MSKQVNLDVYKRQAMGSVNDTIEETIDYMLKQGEKVGVVKVRLYRPFPVEAFLKAVPATCKKIAVLDRTKAVSYTHLSALRSPTF